MLALALFALAAHGSSPMDQREVLKHACSCPSHGLEHGAPPPPVMQEAWDITHYDISLGLDTRTRTIQGAVSMTVQARQEQPSQPLLLHAGDPTIQQLQVEGVDAEYSRSGDELWVTMPETLSEGDSVRVDVAYTAPGTTDSSSTGLHWGDPIYSFSEPDGARDWLVTYDAPSDKATLEWHITAPSDLVVAANGEPGAVDDNPDDTRTWHFSFPWPIATYLMVVNAGSFQYEQDTSGDVPVNLWAKSSDLQQARSVFADTPQMIAHFSDLYGPYPYSIYGNVLVPFGGAMEHTTATSFGENLIRHGDYATIVNVHELGHQWWGDYVTCAEWEEIWLNEGFASYTEALWVEFSEGEDQLARYVWDDQRASYMEWKQYEGEFALYDPDYMWGGTVYDKGSFVVHMLRFVLGDDAFFAGLQHYADTHAHDAATTEDLRAAMESTHGADLSWFFDQWVYRAGEPSYRVGITNTELASGGWQVDYHIEQTSTEHWSMPVELLLGLEDGSEVALTEWVEGPYTVISSCLDQPATDLEFSPDAHLLYGEVETDHDAFEPAPIVCGDVEPGDTGDTGDSGTPTDDTGPHDSEGGIETPKGLCGCTAPPTPWALFLLTTLGALPWLRRRR